MSRKTSLTPEIEAEIESEVTVMRSFSDYIGYRRVAARLRGRGINASDHTVRVYMKRAGLTRPPNGAGSGSMNGDI